MPMTSEQVANIEELIRALIDDERPKFPSAWRGTEARVAAARAVLCGEQPQAEDALCKFCGRQRYTPCMNTRDMSPIDGNNSDPTCHLALKAAGGGERQEIGAAKPDEIEVPREQMIAGRAAFNRTYTTEDAQIRETYRAMRAAEPTRPVTDQEARAAIVELGGYLPTLKTMRAALEDFAKRRGI